MSEFDRLYAEALERINTLREERDALRKQARFDEEVMEKAERYATGQAWRILREHLTDRLAAKEKR